MTLSLAVMYLIKNLGVCFASTLSFSYHFTNIFAGKHNRLYNCYISLKKNLDSYIKILLTETVALSNLHYADIVYDPYLCQCDKLRSQRIQNSCVKYFATFSLYTYFSLSA